MNIFSIFLTILAIWIQGLLPNIMTDIDYMGKVYEITPDEKVESFLPLLEPGDELVLHEGTYDGSLMVEISGIKDYPVIIRGYGNGEDRPVITYDGSSEEAVQIAGEHVILDYLEFRSLDTYCIRIGKKGKGARDITIQNCVFYECGGGDISANYYKVKYEDIRIIDNFFIGSKRTPVYIGSHSGTTPVTHFIFKGNVIDGSQNDGPETTIGYGIELKLNVTKSIIENNYITGTKGPGIMVYGAESQDKYDANIVRNNIVINARKEAGIVVGGGPALIQDNIVMKSKWGIYVQDYADRDLLDHIAIYRNTLVDNLESGLSVRGFKGIEVEQNNAFHEKENRGFVDCPGLSESNKSEEITLPVQQQSDKIVNMIPDEVGTESILKFFRTGPLDTEQLVKLINLILEDHTPTKIGH